MNIPCTYENKTHSAFVKWCFRSGYLIVFKSSTSLLIFCLLGLSVHLLMRKDPWSLQLHLWICLFLLSILSVFAAFILKLSYLVCTHLGLLCLLESWQLCHYEVSLFVLKPVLPVINIATLACIFSHFFGFKSSCKVCLKWVSYKQHTAGSCFSNLVW